MKRRIRLSESELKRIVVESVNRVINEEFGVDLKDTLAWVKRKKPEMSPEEQEKFAWNIIRKRRREKERENRDETSPYDEFKGNDLIPSLEKIASELQSLYYRYEREFDRKWYGECMGLDNITGNLSTYDLTYAIEKGNAKEIADELHRFAMFYEAMMWIADSEGYGSGASQRGFDVTRPMGIFWHRSYKALEIIYDLCDHFEIDHSNWRREGIEYARKANRDYNDWLRVYGK